MSRLGTEDGPPSEAAEAAEGGTREVSHLFIHPSIHRKLRKNTGSFGASGVVAGGQSRHTPRRAANKVY